MMRNDVFIIIIIIITSIIIKFIDESTIRSCDDKYCPVMVNDVYGCLMITSDGEWLVMVNDVRSNFEWFELW